MALLAGGWHGSAVRAAEMPERWRAFARAEQDYSLAEGEPALLNLRYQELLRVSRLRLDTAKKLRLSPEHPAVSEAMTATPSGAEKSAAIQYQYDPTLLTVAAGLESRGYDRGSKELWETIKLSLPADSAAGAYYTKDVPAHCRLGAAASKRLFILLNSSYSTWDRGSWTNKTVALLRAKFGDPHLVVFAGFLTPEFLGLQARLPALGADWPARDLHPRIQSLLAQFKRQRRIPDDTEVALIGFSGGANLVISLLAEDARRVKSGALARSLFARGGIAFSPILDLTTSFAVLDRSSQWLDRQGFPAKQALTSPFVGNALFESLRGFGLSNPEPFFEMTRISSETKPRRADVIARFYREFETVDLATTANARYAGMERRLAAGSAASHRGYYLDAVFPAYRQHFGLDSKVTFDAYTQIEPELSAIERAPLYLVFALDDPVLARSALLPEETPPARCREVLRFASKRPSIRVFSPSFGAHMGYMVDNRFISACLAALDE